MRIEDFKLQRPRFGIPGRLVCAECGGRNADDAQVCRECGEPLYVECQTCGTTNLRYRPVCRVCGHHLRNTLYRRVKRWVVDRHGRLLLKVFLVLLVSYVSSRVIIILAQMGGGGRSDEADSLEAVAEPGMAPSAPQADPEPILVLPGPGKKK